MEGDAKNEQIQYPQIAQELIEMAEADQAMRERAENEEGFWDGEVDEKNTARLQEIVGEIGWPTVSKVGKEASLRAWLLVQHADHDPEFQQHCLDLMKEARDGEVDPHDVAYLEDRVRVNTDRPQLYGTQMDTTFDREGNVISYKPRPIEDPENIDARRASMGMGPHAEYVREILESHHSHLLKE